MPGSTGAAVARARASWRCARSARPMRNRPARRCCTRGRDRVLAADPALPKARQAAAVRSVLEPMILGDMDDLAIGHGPRAADGSVALAWTPREPLRRAWALLGEHGLRVRALIAPQTLEPVTDAPLRTRRSALASRRAILVAGHAAMGADPRLALASGVALDRDRLRDLAGRPEPVCRAVARRGPHCDTDARTSAEGLPQAARGAGCRAPGAPGAGRAARQTGFVVGRRLPAAGARHGPGHALRRRPRRACPTPTTPSR